MLALIQQAYPAAPEQAVNLTTGSRKGAHSFQEQHMCTQRHGTAQHSTAQACLCVRAEECLIDKDGKCWYIFLKWGITTAFSLLSMPPFSKMHWKQRAFVLTGLGEKKSTYIMKSIFLLFFFLCQKLFFWGFWPYMFTTQLFSPVFSEFFSSCPSVRGRQQK